MILLLILWILMLCLWMKNSEWSYVRYVDILVLSHDGKGYKKKPVRIAPLGQFKSLSSLSEMIACFWLSRVQNI